MKKILIALALLVIPTGVALANNAWSIYHWPSSQLTPTVSDRTKGSFYHVPAGVAEWASLAATIDPVLINGNNGNIKVSEASSVFWLGMARVFIDENGHITKGEVKLNTAALASYVQGAGDHVLCQEIGHILGLDHSNDLDSCMNDQAVLGSATSPNAHDAATLLAIYIHDDAAADDDGGGGGPPCSKNPNHPNCQPAGRTSGRWVTVDVFPIPEND